MAKEAELIVARPDGTMQKVGRHVEMPFVDQNGRKGRLYISNSRIEQTVRQLIRLWGKDAAENSTALDLFRDTFGDGEATDLAAEGDRAG